MCQKQKFQSSYQVAKLNKSLQTEAVWHFPLNPMLFKLRATAYNLSILSIRNLWFSKPVSESILDGTMVRFRHEEASSAQK